MYELILERLHGRSEHDAPPLLLDLKDSENKEIISSNAEMLRNGLLNRKMQLYDNECDYVPTKCRKVSEILNKMYCYLLSITRTTFRTIIIVSRKLSQIKTSL